MSEPPQTPYEYDRVAAYIEDYFRQQSPRLEWRVDRYADRVNIERGFPRTYEITGHLRVADETFGCHFSLNSWQFHEPASSDDLLNYIKHRMAVLLAEEIMKS